jgi:hypothetical protein
MTVPINKTISSPLELNYAEMKKQSGGKNPNAAGNKMEGSISGMPEDTVTLSSRQSDSEPLPKFERSQPVTTVEKQALQFQFSAYA